MACCFAANASASFVFVGLFVLAQVSGTVCDSSWP